MEAILTGGLHSLFDMVESIVVLFDDFDDAMGARIDQDGPVVHDRIAIVADAIFRRHIVISDALLGQNGADPNVFVIPIRGAMLFDRVAAKARALIDAKDSIDAADYTADHAANDGSDRTGGPFAIS